MTAAFPYTVATGSYTTEQLEGEACSCCGRTFRVGEKSRPAGRVAGFQLFAHVVSPKVGAKR